MLDVKEPTEFKLHHKTPVDHHVACDNPSTVVKPP